MRLVINQISEGRLPVKVLPTAHEEKMQNQRKIIDMKSINKIQKTKNMQSSQNIVNLKKLTQFKMRHACHHPNFRGKPSRESIVIFQREKEITETESKPDCQHEINKQELNHKTPNIQSEHQQSNKTHKNSNQ